LKDAQLKILDATYHIPPSPQQAREEFEQNRIPGAVFFDIDDISDPTSGLPHMLPSPDAFDRHMQALGIASTDTIVVYDVHGIMSSPRAWWMFRYFGHERVYVLNGGLPKWLAENRPTESGKAFMPTSNTAPFHSQIQPELLCHWETLQVACEQEKAPFQIVDMRSAGRFQAQEPEPRAGLKSGHIPGSINAPWSSWLQPDKTLLSKTDLQARCQTLGLNWEASTVTTCGSGITACVGALALYELGNPDVAVYDGAWAEWGALPNVPIQPR
jgi:thiosulfate/3-mercaptopyruvate sulfurtransferase